MRPQVVVATLLLALGIFGAVWLVSRSARQNTTTTPTATAAPATTQVAASSPAANIAPPAPPSPPAPVITNAPIPTPPGADTQTNHDLYVFDRKAELMETAMDGGPDALNTIWSALSDPDKEIRAGALAALVQLGDSSVSPRLRELASQTEDAQEKLDLQNAANQLELPPIGTKETNQ